MVRIGDDLAAASLQPVQQPLAVYWQTTEAVV